VAGDTFASSPTFAEIAYNASDQFTKLHANIVNKVANFSQAIFGCNCRHSLQTPPGWQGGGFDSELLTAA